MCFGGAGSRATITVPNTGAYDRWKAAWRLAFLRIT